MDDLDHAALRHRFGGKLGIDATEKRAARRRRPAVARGDRHERRGPRARDAALAGVRAVVPRALRHFLDAIKFEHTVFALPFAYIAMVLAAAAGRAGASVVLGDARHGRRRGRSR